MLNIYKVKFFSSLLVVLVVVSNLIGIKFTNFNDLIISVNFITLPFIYLCFLLIYNFSNKKEAYCSLFNGIIIQLVFLFIYFLVVNFNNQSIIPDATRYIDVVFKIDFIYILINLISLAVSTFVLYYIYEYFRIIGYKLLGTVISVLSAIILYGLITIPIINYNFGTYIVLDMLMGHLLMATFMTIIVTIMFYILKDKDYPYEVNKIFINDINIEIPKERKDKSIDEVIKITNKKSINNKSSKKKKNGYYIDKKNNNKKSNSKKNVKK